jgi:hypothetical protein
MRVVNGSGSRIPAIVAAPSLYEPINRYKPIGPDIGRWPLRVFDGRGPSDVGSEANALTARVCRSVSHTRDGEPGLTQRVSPKRSTTYPSWSSPLTSAAAAVRVLPIDLQARSVHSRAKLEAAFH